MANNTLKLGFSYFSSKDYLLERHMQSWFPAIKKWGGTFVILTVNYKSVIPEDVFINTRNCGLEPMLHFNIPLPSLRTFNDCAPLLELYKKWGANYVILGDQPNIRETWQAAGWHEDTLVDQFLDRFIPLANHAVKIGLRPIMAPLKPGGDYWDCAFMELALSGLKQRKLHHVLDALILSSYGYTYQKPLSWGEGGPERWPGSKPYQTPEGQEDQIGFNNFAWVQAESQRVTGKKMSVIILDAGNPGLFTEGLSDQNFVGILGKIITACKRPLTSESDLESEAPVFNEQVLGCSFSLDTLKQFLRSEFSLEGLGPIFMQGKSLKAKPKFKVDDQKLFDHYLLLPSYASGVSDAVWEKVRPVIKKYQPTIGFSLDEALHASKVSIFPDPVRFTDEHYQQLRTAGCDVEILPQSGIEIATILQDE